jgi:biotin carboxyl carrier protein
MSSDPSLERIVEYFERSRFDYLALDYGGKSLRLSRPVRATEVGGIDGSGIAAQRGTSVMNVPAPTVGFVEVAAGRTRFPQAGDAVAKDEALFTLRRHKTVLTVGAAASGTLESVLVGEGDFVEFGQPLAMLSQAN